MIEQGHIRPQSLSDVLNKGFNLGVMMFKKVSYMFYLMTVLYFVAIYFIAAILGINQIGELFLTFATLTYAFFVTAYVIRIMVKETDPSKDFAKWTFIKLVPLLVIASFFYWLAFLLGSLLLIVPGILFFLYFLLFPSIIVLEQKSMFQAFKRSARLVRGSFFRVAVIYVVFLGIQSLAIMMISFFPMNDWWVTALVATLIHLLILPFQATVLNLLYFELRAEKEAFDFDVFHFEAQRQLMA